METAAYIILAIAAWVIFAGAIMMINYLYHRNKAKNDIQFFQEPANREYEYKMYVHLESGIGVLREVKIYKDELHEKPTV